MSTPPARLAASSQRLTGASPVTPIVKPAVAREDTPSPGLWRHPKLQEIARRQRASMFTEDNIHKLLINTGTIAMIWLTRRLLRRVPVIHNALVTPVKNIVGVWPFVIIYFILALNIAHALTPVISPFFRGKDNLIDIDLTASQRSLLGLDPDATPPVTPNTRYVTPPKYARPSSSSRSSSLDRRISSSPVGSPLSRKGSPTARQSGDLSGSPSGSPLWHKVMENTESRRHSYGFSPSLGASSKDLSSFLPSTPSPTGRATGVPISSKWIYEKGRSSSGSRGFCGGM